MALKTDSNMPVQSAQAPDVPLVSVAMITYNHRAYLEKAVEGVLRQKADFPIELVLGEDCSTDGTRELAFKLAQQHPNQIRLVTSEKNVGMLPNAVRVERACRGKYVAYCEGDDYWHDENKLRKQVEFLEAHPEYSLVHSHTHRYYTRTGTLVPNSLRVPRNLDDSRAYEDILLGRRTVLTVTIVVRGDQMNDILDRCPECTDVSWPMGDTQRFLEFARRGKVGCIHEPLATAIYLPESASQSQDANKRLRFFLKARELKLYYLKKYPVSPEVDRAVREKQALILLQHAYEARDSEVATMLYADYVAQHGAPTLRARWLLWGSRSSFRKRLVMPLVKFEGKWRNMRQRWRMGTA
jgi:glycosyltransferase involved in cell wall biosynthesis